MTPAGLPLADAATTAAIRRWLTEFAACVRAVDYAAARPFWHPEVVIFGTWRTLERGLENFVARQWADVWPRTRDFAFDLAATQVLAAADGSMAVAIAPWTSTGFHPDGAPFDRPGRATVVLVRREDDGRWVGVHSHMSLPRGVPQESHGTRAAKAP